jgi:hypothetical protein
VQAGEGAVALESAAAAIPRSASARTWQGIHVRDRGGGIAPVLGIDDARAARAEAAPVARFETCRRPTLWCGADAALSSEAVRN